MARRETEKIRIQPEFWCDEQRALWYVMVFSGVVYYNNYRELITKF